MKVLGFAVQIPEAIWTSKKSIKSPINESAGICGANPRGDMDF
jgi:hypothetical protein